MISRKMIRQARLGTALLALASSMGALCTTVPAQAQPVRTYKPNSQVLLSVGEGQMLSLGRPVADVWISNPTVADVDVSNARQIKLFGKTAGEATVIATASDGSVVYATNVRVSQNISSVGDVLHAAMPESDIKVTNVGQMAILTGTVASPDDSAQAARLVEMMLNPGVDVSKGECKICVFNRLTTATPLQVMLKVRIAEVNRSALKKVGVNLLSHDSGRGLFNIGRGDAGVINTVKGAADPATGYQPVTVTGATFNNLTGATTLGFFGRVLGLDLLSTIDLMQNDGFVSTLAEPNLTALSGETASFLAGGEFPIPISQGNSAVTIEYKQYGVGIAFTPIVLADGRISMRVRPEVSELSDSGSIKLNGFVVPSLTTRRAETTVELGSGQSFMLAGLLQNRNNNSIERAPFLGDLPILGSLFRSTSYQRNETELVIIVTPYLVRPTSGQLALPTNGYRAPSDPEQILEGKLFTGTSGPVASPAPAPAPSLSGAVSSTAAPGFKL
jgi:pilus assembly protein CpaC